MPPFAAWSCTDAPGTLVEVEVIVPYPRQNHKVIAVMRYLGAVLRRRFPLDEGLFHRFPDAEDDKIRNPKLEEKVGMKCVYTIAFSENSKVIKAKLLVLMVNDATQKISISQRIKGGPDDTEARNYLGQPNRNDMYVFSPASDPSSCTCSFTYPAHSNTHRANILSLATKRSYSTSRETMYTCQMPSPGG
jgi:hypothetical protein